MEAFVQGGGWAAVVVNYNAAVFLNGCLAALFASDLPPTEVVLVDNASGDDSLQELAAWPQVIVEASVENLGFAGGANRGIGLTEAPVVVVLNPDVEVDRAFGRSLVALFADNPRLGAAGPKLRYPDSQTLQHAGGELNWPLLTTQHRGYGQPDGGRWAAASDVDFVTGGAMALRRAAFDAVGGFDERFWPAYYEDVDLCLRLRAAGWQVRYEPGLSATHVESVGLGRSLDYYRLFHRNRLRFALKHLSPADWAGRFVPAEIQRLRGELQVVKDADWPVRSGAEAIEAMARLGPEPNQHDAGLLDGGPLSDSIDALLMARRERELLEAQLAGLSQGRTGGLLRPAVLKLTSAGIPWRQQALNDALIRLLDAQDRLNRELVAQTLLALLNVIGWTAFAGRTSADR